MPCVNDTLSSERLKKRFLDRAGLERLSICSTGAPLSVHPIERMQVAPLTSGFYKSAGYLSNGRRLKAEGSRQF